MSTNRGRKIRLGFSMLEILVAIGIITLLLALIAPAVQWARERARSAKCLNNFRQIGLALHTYHDINGQLPMGFPSPPDGIPRDFNVRSVHVAVLPYLDSQDVYDRFNFSCRIFGSARNHTAEMGMPGVFVCPSDPIANPHDGPPFALFPDADPPNGRWPIRLSQYGYFRSSTNGDPWFDRTQMPPVANGFGQDGCFNWLQSIRHSDIRDGLSQTLFATERALEIQYTLSQVDSTLGRWIGGYFQWNSADASLPPNAVFRAGDDADKVSINPASYHAGGVNVLLADGSARFVSDNIDSWTVALLAGPSPCQFPEGCKVPFGVWQALASRAGGEQNTGNW